MMPGASLLSCGYWNLQTRPSFHILAANTPLRPSPDCQAAANATSQPAQQQENESAGTEDADMEAHAAADQAAAADREAHMQAQEAKDAGTQARTGRCCCCGSNSCRCSCCGCCDGCCCRAGSKKLFNQNPESIPHCQPCVPGWCSSVASTTPLPHACMHAFTASGAAGVCRPLPGHLQAGPGGARQQQAFRRRCEAHAQGCRL